jgi:hypothetical protein
LRRKRRRDSHRAGTAKSVQGLAAAPLDSLESLRAADGSLEEVQLLADTGNPCALIIGSNAMKRFKRGDAPDMGSNFGPLTGGWLQVLLNDIGFDRHMVGYASDAVVSAAKVSHRVLAAW